MVIAVFHLPDVDVYIPSCEIQHIPTPWWLLTKMLGNFEGQMDGKSASSEDIVYVTMIQIEHCK
jgi:hypothetical protein